MTARLKIGPGFTLPLDAITTATATFGIRGSGKTNTNVVMVEEFLEHRLQVVIIDPTDAWWGLKSSKDGRKAGYPIIVLGGRRADLPLGGADGTTIADFVVDTGASVILSLRHFESDAERRRLVTDFARRLYHRKGQQDAPSPIMVVIDEASLVVPQRVMGEDAKMVGAIQRLVRQGRSSGIGVNLIDARPATVNKDVLAGVEMLVTHRVTSPKDRKALQEYVEQHDPDGTAAAFLKELANLPQGTAWFWSPGWLEVFESVEVRERRTFDSSRTPKAGEVAIVPTKMADIDLDAIRAKLGQSIEKAKAEDPKELHRRIRELEEQVRKGSTAARVVEKPVADERAMQRAVASAVKPWQDWAKRYAAQVARAFGHVKSGFDAMQTFPAPPATAEAVAYTAPALPRSPVTAPPPREVRRMHRSADVTATEHGVTTSEQKLINAAALIEQIGASRDVATLAFFSGYTVGGRFNNLKGALKAKGLFGYPGDGQVELTGEGRAVARADEADVQSLDDLHALWLKKLPASEAKVLEVVIGAWPEEIAKSELADRTDYTIGGRFNNIVGRLRSLGAVDYPRDGHVRASRALFPEGL